MRQKYRRRGDYRRAADISARPRFERISTYIYSREDSKPYRSQPIVLEAIAEVISDKWHSIG